MTKPVCCVGGPEDEIVVLRVGHQDGGLLLDRGAHDAAAHRDPDLLDRLGLGPGRVAAHDEAGLTVEQPEGLGLGLDRLVDLLQDQRDQDLGVQGLLQVSADLLRQALAFVVAPLLLVEPGVLDGEGRVAGQGGDQGFIGLRERGPAPLVRDDDGAQPFPMGHQHRKDRLRAPRHATPARYSLAHRGSRRRRS